MKSQEKLPRAMADYGKRFEQGLEQMSPFEIKNDLISYAKECDQKAVCQFLNAGRGNPNWINTVAREAFFLLGTFAIEESKLTFELPEEAYFTPKYISNDNRYLIDWEQPENDNNPVLILVEP